MIDYSITFARSARKQLEGLDTYLIRRIISRIEDLTKDPRPKDCKKIQGEENLWRIRIGDYRIIYEIDDEKRSVDINNIRHRKEAYR